MKLICHHRPIPRTFSTHPHARNLIYEHDIKITPHGRLRAKLLVFRTARDLRRFWRVALSKSDLGVKTRGAVNSLATEVITIKPNVRHGATEQRHIAADPRYFVVIGLVATSLTMEVIAHESVHAAYAFVKRVRRAPWDAQARHFDEESIAYPAGRIATAINRSLHAKKLYT